MKSILYVDDARSMRSLVDLILNKQFAVTLAEDGIAGLKAMETAQFDLIISDINMPNMNGFEFLQQVRLQPAYQELPILMMTTEADLEMKQKGKALGANGWITKPFDPDKLVDTIEFLLGS
ncbi:response regulator [Thiomicrorhabdus sp. zzn3]|uniref:response regulator n=1 Tax=Thiomicrorhabdus sp. zzn3 TaxID=3039775 RepID=UPI002436C4EC|nr:response regulator [Thiomicrorhabdus sp. zzn3]MDG6777859.1 response regulator [Thiomicrorhabdus sp. zzn3]